MTQEVMIELMGNLLTQYESKLPGSNKIIKWIEQSRMLDAPAIKKKLMRIDEVQQLIPILDQVSDGMSNEEVRETLLSVAEIKYPSVIEMLNENEEDGQKVMDLLKMMTEGLGGTTRSD